jgi:hypothetical protein
MSPATTFTATLFGIAVVLVAATQSSDAQTMAAQRYPYCQVNSASGGLNCYISSRSQCEYREQCVRNPWYLSDKSGDKAARAWKRKEDDTLWLRW